MHLASGFEETPRQQVVVDLNDTEHDAPTTEPGHNYMFDPEKAMDPPFLKNSEILARLSQEELELPTVVEFVGPCPPTTHL